MTDFPIIETYRGVGIHDNQPADRIKRVVKPAIDAVYRMSDPAALAAYAADLTRPPEARLFAAARCEAIWELAAADRMTRPANLDLVRVRASVAGLGSLEWADPSRYCSLLDVLPVLGGAEEPRRETSLDEHDAGA